MNRGTWLWLAALASLAGCGTTEVYEVGMDVEGSVIIRSINVQVEIGTPIVTATAANGPASGPASRPAASQPERPRTPGDLDAIAAIYKVAPARSQPWKRGFVGRTPDDVGGAGEIEQFPSEMGSAWIYLERFRGDPDPAGTLQERLRSADIFASVIAGWARARLEDRKDFEKLGAYLDGDFRKDVRNLSLFIWTAGAVHDMSTLQGSGDPNRPEDKKAPQHSSAQADVAAIAIQYFVERKYLTMEDALALVRLLVLPSEEDGIAVPKRLLRKFMTDKVGLTDKDLIEQVVAIIDQSKNPAASLDAYVVSSSEYKEHAKRLARPPADGPSSRLAGASNSPGLAFVSALAELAFAATGVEIIPTSDELRLTLVSKDAPALTNGTWDQKAGMIRWNRRISQRASTSQHPLPAVCYAVWSRPDERSQARHFGRVILRGGGLASYCAWQKTLTPVEAGAWGAFLAGLQPETAAVQLALFHSARSKAATAPSEKDKLAEGAGMLADALRKPPAGRTSPATTRPGR